jgi:uncharacterized protein YpuA (DUF1002 family)
VALKPLTVEEIKAKLRSTHPADRPKVVTSDPYKAPVQQAKVVAEKMMEGAAKKVEQLEAHIEKLTGQLRQVATGLEVRKRMTPNDLRDALNSMFETYNFSPAEEMVQMLRDPNHPYYVIEIPQRLKILSELQSYVMPKLKSTEVTGEVKHKHTIVIKRYGADGIAKMEEAPVIQAMETRRAIDVTSEVRSE